MREAIKDIRDADPKAWQKRLGSRPGDLFWADGEKLVIITKSGARSALSPREILEIERKELKERPEFRAGGLGGQ